jgi:phosphatidylglycerol:prolipoprotein diacylglycerol transferase
MYPTLIEIGGVTITSFGLMMFLSFLSAAWILSLQLQRRGLNPEFAWDVLAWVAVGGILGAKLYYLGLHWEDLVADPVGQLTSRAGLVWYGGLIGGILAYYWQVKRRGLPMGPAFDATAPALMLAYAVGRLGCFLVGDDYGLPTESWVGIAFPQGAPPSTAGYLRSIGAEVPAGIPDSAILRVHPTQLYEVGAALILFAVIWKVSARKLRPGQLFGLYLGLYGLERFLVEFVRAKSDRVLLGLSTSQLASVLLIGAAVYIWQRKGGAPAAPIAGGAETSGTASAARAGARQ